MQAGSKPRIQWCLFPRARKSALSPSLVLTPLVTAANCCGRSHLGDYFPSTLGPPAAGVEKLCRNPNARKEVVVYRQRSEYWSPMQRASTSAQPKSMWRSRPIAARNPSAAFLLSRMT
jgi:hypothetical protein